MRNMCCFANFTNSRKNIFAVCTTIYEKNGKKYVCKRSLYSSGERHIRAIEENYRILTNIYGKKRVAKCFLKHHDTLIMEFINGKTLSSLLYEYLESEDMNSFYSLMNTYIDFVKIMFEENGNYDNKIDEHSFYSVHRKINIDLLFDNIIVKDGEFIIIDYEWMIPKAKHEFIIYRAIKLFIERYNLSMSLYNSLNNKYISILDECIEFDKKFLQIVLNKGIGAYQKNISMLNDIMCKHSDLIAHLRCQNKNLTEEKENISREIENIKNTKGYKKLEQLRSMRSKTLGRISKAWHLSRDLYHKRDLINVNNVQKLFMLVKNREFKRAYESTKRKLNKYQKTNEIRYINDCLISKSNITLKESVDIIVPIYNAYEYTVRCIQSIYDNTATDYNLILINDKSSDSRINDFLLELEKTTRPNYMKKLYIIHNKVNLGFIKTVNKGLNMSNNNVVILNTDTEVPLGWLERIVTHIENDDKIASVTPFSNSATICSFPEICTDNRLPGNISVDELDQIFRDYGTTDAIEIPTGVGFCMAMSRKVINQIGFLDEVYGKGYAEENDWCCRASSSGFKNVMITNLYVYHKHGVSFGEIKSKSKQERINENLKILSNRYPNYFLQVDNFIANDPVKQIREFIRIIMERKLENNIPAELVVNHSLGGGATTYAMRRMNADTHKRYFYMELLADGKTCRITTFGFNQNTVFYFDFWELDRVFIRKLIKCFRIGHVFVNHIIDYPIKKIFEMLNNINVEYEFFIHDFYCICPRYTLINKQGIYCKVEQNKDVCMNCVNDQVMHYDIEQYRNDFLAFLKGAEKVTAPSKNTADIVKKYYPQINIDVQEHEIPDHLQKTYKKEFAQEKILHISVLGAIGIQKGSKIIYELVEKIEHEKLPIKITVIGYTDRQSSAYINESNTLEITGPYDNRQVSKLLADYNTAIVLIPSVWPETYSYTVSEAIYSGYKVLAFNIGAPADRIVETGMGWIVDEISSQAILEKLKEIKSDTDKKI